MKQLLQNLKTGETSIVEVPVPESKPGRALVQTAVSLVSAGTERMLVEFGEKNLLDKALTRPDLVKQMLEKARRDGFLATVKSALNRLDEPLALGYSSAGRIVELGSGMSSFKVGQRVACAGGGYAVHAEYALVPGNLLVALPDEVDYESAAFGTLGAIGMHGFRLAEARLGEYVAVIGLGLLGFLTAQIAASAGANVLGIELNPDRIQLAEKLGIPVCPREGANDAALAFTNQHGFDVILICADATTNDPVELAGVIARDRARVVALGAVGLDLPRKIYYEKELTFINSRSYGPGRYDPAYEEKGQDYPIGYVRWTEGRNLEAVIALMAAGRLNVLPLITHRIPIDHADHAYDIITGKTKEPFLGVLLTYKEEQADTAHRVDLKSVGVQRRSPSPRGASVRLGVIGAGNFANAVMLPSIKKSR